MMPKTTVLPVRQKKHCDEFAAPEILGLTGATMRDWRLRKFGPVYAKFGKSVRYPMEELEKFADSCRVRMAA